jgi:hypothetical protein
MPDHDGELACSRDGSDMLATAGPDAEEKSAQRSWRSRRRPGRFDEHTARMSAALLGDPTMVGGAWSGLPDAWVQAEITHKLLRLIETGHLADRRLHRQRDGHVDTGDGHQALHAIISEGRAGKIAFDDLEVVAEPIELTQMPLDRQPLILRHDLLIQPCTARGAAQVGMRAGRDQVSVQDRLDDVLQPRSLPNDLVATGDLPA